MSVAGSFLLLLHLWPVVHLPPIDTCVNVCVFPRERDSLFHMLRWHPWCRRGRGVFGRAVRVFTSVMIACNHCPPPPPPPPLYKDPGALSICLKKQVESLKEQNYSQTSCLSYRFRHQGKLDVHVYIWFLHICFLFFFSRPCKWLKMP